MSSKQTDREMLEEYRKNRNLADYTKKGIWYSLINETSPFLLCVLKSTVQTVVELFSWYLAIIGIFISIITGVVPEKNKLKYLLNMLFISAVIFIVIILAVAIKNLYLFSREKLRLTVNSTEIVFAKNSFIDSVNKLLLENANSDPSKQQDLVFAVGINKTLLTTFMEDPQNNTVVGRYPGVLMDFYILMKENLSIDIHDEIEKRLEGISSLEEAFPNGILNVEYTITNGINTFSKVNGTKFIVAYYINSFSDGIAEFVSNPRVSIIGLFNYYNEHLVRFSDRSTKTTLVLPLIGTGGGQLPFRNALLEIVNNLERENSLMPSRLIIPIHREQIVENSFEAINVLKFMQKIMK